MKNFYGKTRQNNGFQALREVILLSPDQFARYLLIVSSKRPCLIPAVLMLLCCYLSFYFASVIPAIIMSFAVLMFAVCLKPSHFALCQSNVNKSGCLIISAFLCMALVFSGYVISSDLKYECETGECQYICHITDVSYDLSGDADVTVRLENGARVELRFRDEKQDLLSLDPGDCLKIYGKLKVPDKAGNPGEFDYREYLRSRGILYIFSCEHYKVIRKSRFPINIFADLQRFFFDLKKSAVDTVTSGFDETYTAIAAGVCTGDKSLVNDDIIRDFRLSCCSHLLAVSGTHFAGFLACLPLFLEMLNIKRRKAFVIHVVFALLIGCMTGWTDSVTRSAVMSICIFAMRDWVSAVSLASVVMIAADPFSPMSSGFKMSFCAVIAIKLFSGRLARLFKCLRLGERLSGMLAAPVAAMLGMIPFWEDISMRPDLLHMVIQIAASFAAQTACTCFVPCLILCSLLPFWACYLSAPVLLCLKALMLIVKNGASLTEKSGAAFHPGKPFLAALAVALFLFMLPECLVKRLFQKLSAVVLAVALGFEMIPVLNKPVCRVVFADVGQGDCCLIMTPDMSCLIDGGTYEKGDSTVRDILDYYGIYQVDICIMSHWDADHAGGIAALFGQGRTRIISANYVPSFDDRDKDVEEFFKATGLNGDLKKDFLSQLQLLTAGERIDLSEQVYLDVLYPSSASNGGNESSLVLMLHIIGEDDTSILFTGDIGTVTESQLTGSGTDLDCDILKVAHHGSKYSSSEEFIDACSPEIAVISVGAYNFYGHPAPSTLDRLDSYGCIVFRTDEEGAVMLEY